MRSYCAIYVDAGYLIAAAATRVTGTSLRSSVQVDHRQLIERLIEQAEQDSGLPLLRVNWYDSGARPGGRPDLIQDDIGLLPKVKLRLGRLSHTGEQKGVDVRIGLDLVTQGRGRFVDVMYLVSGDDDLTEAVEEAQEHGVRVVVLAVPSRDDRPHAVSRHLQRAADAVVLIDPDAVDQAVRKTAMPEDFVATLAAGHSDADDAEPLAAATPEGPADAIADGVDAPSMPGSSLADGPATPAASAGISPAMLAKRRPTTVVVPGSVVELAAAQDQFGGASEQGEITDELIDVVVAKVISAWCATATPEAFYALQRAKPVIPGDVDRTLLLDLSSRAGGTTVDDASRYEMRARFWEIIDRVKVR